MGLFYEEIELKDKTRFKFKFAYSLLIIISLTFIILFFVWRVNLEVRLICLLFSAIGTFLVYRINNSFKNYKHKIYGNVFKFNYTIDVFKNKDGSYKDIYQTIESKDNGKNKKNIDKNMKKIEKHEIQSKFEKNNK